MKRINIMTSCDDNLAKYILPQIASINENLDKYDVRFYLVHTRVRQENVELIKEYTVNQTHITFYEIKINENIPFYESLVASGGGQWPCEAYFTLRVQDYMPDDVDRVMYIDAGDVIINGDIAPYYFGEFNDRSIIATPLGFKTNPVTNEKELFTNDDVLTVSNGSLFNSGSYILNVEKFRKNGYTIDDYLYLADLLNKNTKPGSMAFFGDQGFLAAAFVGDVKFFAYPEIKDPSYMPYNFRSSYWGLFKNEPSYTPVVLHYAIISKPWVVRFSEEVINSIIDKPGFVGNHLIAPIPHIAFMTPQHLRLGEVWWDYAKKTPIYDEVDVRARITADSWVKHYLPMCFNYINACYQFAQKQK